MKNKKSNGQNISFILIFLLYACMRAAAAGGGFMYVCESILASSRICALAHLFAKQETISRLPATISHRKKIRF